MNMGYSAMSSQLTFVFQEQDSIETVQVEPN